MAEPRQENPRSAFFPCFWLGLVLVGTKVFYVPLLGEMPEGVVDAFLVLATLSAADLLFCAVIYACASGALFFSRHKPRLHRAVWVATVLLGAASTVFAIASLRLAQVLRMIPTYSLIYLAGDLKIMQSSISSSIPWKIMAALVIAPAAYVALALATRRVRAANSPAQFRVVSVATLVLVAALHIWARQRVTGEWGRQEDARALADNPHYTFVKSLVDAVFQGTTKLNETYPKEFTEDFKIESQRTTRSGITQDLPRGPRNLIVVVAESTSTEHLSLYGSRFQTWPRMQAEAKHAIVFNNFYSHLTNTANSLVALTLSIYPPMSWREFTVEQPTVPGKTVAEILKVAGYRTAFISGGHNDFANQSAFLKNRGYDVISDMRDIAGPKTTTGAVDDKATVNHILKFVDESRGRPFFAFTWSQATHHPYDPAPDWERTDYLRGDKAWGDMGKELEAYLNAQHELDKALGNLLDGLRQRGLENDTLVVITGDHGQAFGRPHKTYYHSGRVYQEDVNVPLMVWSPKLWSDAPRSQTIGAHVDLSPTLLDLLGLPIPDTFQGRSMFAPDRPPRAYFYGAMDAFMLGVREDQHKYIFNATRGDEELYDLSRDVTEQRNLAAKDPERCKLFRQRLSAWVDYQKSANKLSGLR